MLQTDANNIGFYINTLWKICEFQISLAPNNNNSTRPPRLCDGYGWFDSHNSGRYYVDLSINDFRLGGFAYHYQLWLFGFAANFRIKQKQNEHVTNILAMV